MGSKKSKTVYTPAPPPPGPAQEVPTQSLQTQTALNEISGAQQRLNMTLGSQLDQQNKSFYTDQDIRQTQAVGGETRATIATQGEQERSTVGAKGEQERLGYQTQGEQQRLGYQTQGEQQRLGYQTQGEQQRLGIQTGGEEERKTNLQQYAQQNYVQGRQHDWAQSAYRA